MAVTFEKPAALELVEAVGKPKEQQEFIRLLARLLLG
jgi:hypothetical protein